MNAYQTAEDRQRIAQGCACGHVVIARRSSPQYSLLAHYRSPQHRQSAWGQAVQMNSSSTFLDPYEARLESPTAKRGAGDVSRRLTRASTTPAGEPAA